MSFLTVLLILILAVILIANLALIGGLYFIDTLMSMGEIERLRNLDAGTSCAPLVEGQIRRWKPKAVPQRQDKA